MIYLEASPSAALAGCVGKLWYCSAPHVPHRRERVLPNGCLQMIISLAAADPQILVGARGRYEVIDMCDLVELVGVVFRPGGLGPWLRQRADAFFELEIPLGDVWRGPSARMHLTEEPTPERKLARLDALLAASLCGREVRRKPLVEAALVSLCRTSVRETAQSLNLSERRLHQVFCEDVGLSPKLWSRVHRFQRAVTALHGGAPMRWDQLALECGYYDQSHFANDFRAFSGIDPTTYSEHRSIWKNHVVYD